MKKNRKKKTRVNRMKQGRKQTRKKSKKYRE